MKIQHATSTEQLDQVRLLIREYADSLGVDLCFQGLEEELRGLPGLYAQPKGCILLATYGDEAMGLVALKPLPDKALAAEMKRLYVKPAARGLHLGRQLVEALCDYARAQHYEAIYLDTLPTMIAAQAMYRSMGFEPTEAYVYNPIQGTQYLKLNL